MALRIKDKRANHSSQDLHYSPEPHHRVPRHSPINHFPINHLPPVNGYASAGQLKAYKVFETHSPHKTQVIVVSCNKHPEEVLKFIDTSTALFNTHCEACIVSKDNDIRQMKLERISDVYTRVTKLLKTQAEQFKTLEHKIDVMTKDIKITNAGLHPVMGKIDFMEKQVMLQVEGLFRKLRQKFTKFNPFKNTKDDIRQRLDEVNQKLDDLSYQDAESLNSLRNLLKAEIKTREETKAYIAQVKGRIENKKSEEMPTERDVGIMQNAFDEFYEALTRTCDKFAYNVSKCGNS